MQCEKHGLCKENAVGGRWGSEVLFVFVILPKIFVSHTATQNVWTPYLLAQ